MEEFDHELLISVTGGLGTWHEDEFGRGAYVKDADCLGSPVCTDLTHLEARPLVLQIEHSIKVVADLNLWL